MSGARMNKLYERFRVLPGAHPHLADVDTLPPPEYRSCDGKALLKQLAENNRRIARLQNDLYFENRQSLLIVLQALDAGGKDGTINNVFYAMNPQGCRVQSFKTPTPLEQAHDFLWRVHSVAPRTGEVVIFNRSYYESVLVERVHHLVSEREIEFRYGAINHFEELLDFHRTRIVKFYLHISKAEQLRRFVRRLKSPEKHWKISANDYPERKFWDEYIAAFEAAMAHCSTAIAPWFVIPADDKSFRNLAVSEIILRTLEDMKIKVPEPSVDLQQTRKLAAIELARQRKEERRRREEAKNRERKS